MRPELIFRWIARLLATLMFIFLGVFFLEHLVEWFLHSGGQPPTFVYILQALHLGMLVGYIIAWKWELAGAIVIEASSLTWTIIINAPAAWIISSINLVIAALFFFAWMKGKTKTATPIDAAVE